MFNLLRKKHSMDCNYNNLHQHLLDYYKDTISFKSPAVSKDKIKHLKNTIKYPAEAIANEAKIIEKLALDNKIFRTTWGNDPKFYQPFNQQLCKADPEAINRLRLIFFYSGWPIISYYSKETFPVIDPTFIRYLKGINHTPTHLQFQAPDSCGEAGWKFGNGIVNHDVAIAQERLQFLYFTGVFQHLNSYAKPTCLEIGSGIGMGAMALAQSCSSIDYFIVDVPTVLAQSFSYLSVNKPNWAHDFVTADGIINTTHKEATHRIIYVPSYLLPQILPNINPSLIINFMSLHEMTDLQISYYSENIADILRKNNGIFMEFNSYSGHSNHRTFPEMQKHFNHFRRFEFSSLGMVPTLWTNSFDAIEKSGEIYKNFSKKINFDDIFGFDAYMEYPYLNNIQIQKLLDKHLGSFINCSITEWMNFHKLEHANHLSFNRHIMEEKFRSLSNNQGDERFWHQL